MSKNIFDNGVSVSTGNTESSTTSPVYTRVPGVDMTLVIASPPHLVKENSAKVETKVEYREPHDRGR